MIEDPKQLAGEQHRKAFTLLAMLFVALFISVNLVAQKIVPLGGGLILTAGDFVYPLLYIISILLTEVYGYAMSRRIIWGSFGANLLAILVIEFSIWLPAADSFKYQTEFQIVLGQTPRLFIASLTAFLVGEFISTYLVAKLKILTRGRHLWLRMLSATGIGQFIDSLVFTTAAFVGVTSLHEVLVLTVMAYVCKLVYQVALLPLTYPAAKRLKQYEGINIFDRKTNFNPFNLGV